MNLRGKPEKIVVVKVVVTDSRGKRKTTLRRYRTCAKNAGANTHDLRRLRAAPRSR